MKNVFTLMGLLLASIVYCQISYTFTSKLSDYNVQPEQVYKKITHSQADLFTAQEGSPQLPVFSKRFVLPAGSTVTDVVISNQNSTLVSNNIYLYPTQPPKDWKTEPEFVSPNPTVYNVPNPYPSVTVTKSEDNISQGYHLITLEFCPFKYIPNQKKLYLYRNVNINIQYSIGKVKLTEKISRKRQDLTQEWVVAQVENPKLINTIPKTAKTVLSAPLETNKRVLHWKPSAYGDVPDYIIITSQEFKSQFETLATYKSKRGIPTLVVTTEQIEQNFAGIDKAEKIRNYLKSAYHFWGSGLFVLLGGDTAIIPGRIASYYSEESNASDLYYCDVYKEGEPDYNWNANGNNHFGEQGSEGDELDLGGDNFIGRAPVDAPNEVENFINKVLKYENLTGVSDKGYLNNLLFLGSYLSYNHGINRGYSGGQKWHDDVSDEDFLSNNINLKKWKLYDDYIGPPYHDYPGNEELNKVNTLNRLSNGHQSIGKFHMVSHYDHGGNYGISTSGKMKHNSIYREDMDALTNGDYLQIMYTTSCLSGNFSLDAFAEHYINNVNGGGVAIIANSQSVSSDDDGVNQEKKLFHSIYGNYSTNSYVMGLAFANARKGICYYYPQRQKVLTLFGDPTMATWSATPQNITLSTPTSITINNSTENALNVGINILSEDATITLYKYNALTDYPEVYATQIVEAGETNAVFNLNPDTEGSLIVQATAKNYLPATNTVNIVMPQPHLYITNFTYNDANGNGLIEQGENIALNINLKNSGGAAINNINTVLSCAPELATITQANVSYASTVNPGQTIELSGYTFKPLVEMNVDDIPDFIEFHLDISGSNNYSHVDNFYLDLHSPNLALGTRALKNNAGDNIMSFTLNEEVNANILLHNYGNIATGALTATLSSDLVENGVVEILASASSYNNIDILSQGENITPFKFKLVQPHTGEMPFTLTLTNEFGNTWEFDFDMNEPLPPLITGFDFTSSKNQINLIWDTLSNIKGYNVYRSDEENGIYEKVNDYLITGTSALSDYNLEEATEYFYKISVVSLSGNELLLENVVTQDTPPKQGYLTWTSLEKHNGFPIPSMANRSQASPTLYDVDGNGQKEIFLNFRKTSESDGLIVGFKQDGQEIFDIDGNPTTLSGFAETDIAMVPNSAIGDVDNDGKAEVFSIGRNNATGQGLLYAYKTIDEDESGPGYGMPDLLWEGHDYLNIGHRVFRNPVLFDVNNDGFLEIIVSDENQRIHVYDKDKNIVPGWPVQVGNEDYSQGEIAVADIDNDGMAEIAFGVRQSTGTKGGVYVFNHDGTPFTTNPFKEFANGERADSGITFADFDNDSELELLLTTRKNSVGRVYAFNLDGTPVNNNWNGAMTFQTSAVSHILPRISVGDINNNNELEVVFGSKDKLYVLDKNGNFLPGFPKTVGDMKAYTPILADIDGDEGIEIIANTDGKINAYNYDGSECVGWRLESDNHSPFVGSPSVDDIDNDGLNELVISSKDCTVYAWDTSGDKNRIEWGSHRSDTFNTGVYNGGCLDDVDLYIKDGPLDLGIEPNTFTQHMWTSQDIWIRNENDNSLEHQNPEYKSDNQPNYIKIRVKNKGCKASAGTETLTINWAKANTNLTYPEYWNGDIVNGAGYHLGGQVIGCPVPIPVIQPGEEAIITIPWIIPNPNNYASGLGSENIWHFCLLATINSSTDPLTHDYTSNPNIMVRENNNQAWKNLTVVNLVEESNSSNSLSAVVAISNPKNHPKTYFLELVKEPNEGGKAIFDEAEVTLKMDNTLYEAWERGGKEATNLDDKQLENQKLVKGNNVILDNVSFKANDYALLNLKFNFLTKELTDKTKFTYHVIQKDIQTGEVLGGETFIIRKPSRNQFQANAGDDVEVGLNETITLSAEDINEPAIYNWYDSKGNLIFQGKDLEVANAVAEKYKLEVISSVDGFKDYDEVEVFVKPSKIDIIAPNPASNQLSVRYTLNEVSSAYLMVIGYYGNYTSYNYILNVNHSETTIDVSQYPLGFYTIALICDGVVVDEKTLIKQ